MYLYLYTHTQTQWCLCPSLSPIMKAREPFIVLASRKRCSYARISGVDEPFDGLDESLEALLVVTVDEIEVIRTLNAIQTHTRLVCMTTHITYSTAQHSTAPLQRLYPTYTRPPSSHAPTMRRYLGPLVVALSMRQGDVRVATAQYESLRHTIRELVGGGCPLM